MRMKLWEALNRWRVQMVIDRRPARQINRVSKLCCLLRKDWRE